MPGRNVDEIVKRLEASYTTRSYNEDPFKVLIFTILSQQEMKTPL